MDVLIEVVPVDDEALAVLSSLSGSSQHLVGLTGPSMADLTLTISMPSEERTTTTDAKLRCVLLPAAGPRTHILSKAPASSAVSSDEKVMHVSGPGDQVLYVGSTIERVKNFWKLKSAEHLQAISGFKPFAHPSSPGRMVTSVDEACRLLLALPVAPLSASVFCVERGDTTYVFEF